MADDVYKVRVRNTKGEQVATFQVTSKRLDRAMDLAKSKALGLGYAGAGVSVVAGEERTLVAVVRSASK